MTFDETHEGAYRIHVGALDSPHGGFTAAVVVCRMEPGGRKAREAFRDDSIAFGYRWATAEQAMAYALNRGREMVRTGSPMLAC